MPCLDGVNLTHLGQDGGLPIQYPGQGQPVDARLCSGLAGLQIQGGQDIVPQGEGSVMDPIRLERQVRPQRPDEETGLKPIWFQSGRRAICPRP